MGSSAVPMLEFSCKREREREQAMATARSPTWLLRYFSRSLSSAAAQTAPPASTACEKAATGETSDTGVAPKKKRSKKKKNFFEVAQYLPCWGVGAKLAKSHWDPLAYYVVTNVRLYKNGRQGKAWGIFHNAGAPQTGEAEKIGGVNKRCWRYIEDPPERLYRRL
eukprot:c18974_g1_i2 orf=366-860(+)